MESIDIMGEVDTITAEQISENDKAEKEANLVPKGSWEGLVITWSKTEESEKNADTSQFVGIPQYRVGVKFYDCPATGQAKTQFFNMTPQKMLGPGGKPKKAYTSLLGMYKALHMEGQAVAEVLEQAKVTRLKYKVDEFTPEGRDTINYLQAVSAL